MQDVHMQAVHTLSSLACRLLKYVRVHRDELVASKSAGKAEGKK